MHFLLTMLKVVYVLTTPMPELMEDATVEAIKIRAKWENDDYICKGHILNGMSDSLFDVYTNVESAKELWDSLESKYMAEDASSKKFLLPPSWKDFKHGKDALSLVQLGSHLRIEESLRAQDSDKGKGKKVGGPSVNMIEEGKNKHNKQNKGKNRSNKNNSGSSSNKQSRNVGNMARHVTSKGIVVVVKRITQMLVVRERGLKTIPKTKGSVVLELSSGKTVTLFNVLYVPKLRKNLVSGPVLNKYGYKQVYKSDKYILSKCGVFVGFGYYNNGHVHYKRMLEMSKDDLIPAIDENPEKCTTCDGRRNMHFCWTMLKVVYVLTTPMPELMEDATVEAIKIRAKLENDVYL
ncbi:hypothetical protein Tco_0695106 [Tanacetum coccineum]